MNYKILSNRLLKSPSAIYSLLSLSFVAITIVINIILYPSNNILSWDVFGYYLYLPGLFIYNDLGIENAVWASNIIEIYNNTNTLYQFTESSIGYNVIQYTMGMAILFSPFFFFRAYSCFNNGLSYRWFFGTV